MEIESEKGTQKAMHMLHMHISIIMVTVIAAFFMIHISFPDVFIMAE